MLLFHFLSACRATQAIELRRLKVSRLKELNDPFEMFAVDMSDRRHWSALTKFKDQLHDEFGLHCFSDGWSNPLLWGHYANSHKGIALCFEVTSTCVEKVSYTSVRSKIEFDPIERCVRDPERAMTLLLSTKYIDWQYENEFRIRVPMSETTEDSGRHFTAFSNSLELREIVLGMKCDASRAEMEKVLGQAFQGIKVTRAEMSLTAFSMIEGDSIVE